MRYDTEDLHVMRLSDSEFCGNLSVQGAYYLRCKRYFVPVFCIFTLFSYSSMQEMYTNIWCSESHNELRSQMDFY